MAVNYFQLDPERQTFLIQLFNVVSSW